MTSSFSFLFATVATAALICSSAHASGDTDQVSDEIVAAQRASLAKASEGGGFGPQSPRDIGEISGSNARVFGAAPEITALTLCDIHFHENAEHKGGEFTTYAGNGDGEGNGTGFKFDGELTDAELAATAATIGESEHGDLVPGDTIEIHFVFSSAQATLGNSLNTCLVGGIGNPQLRVEAVVAVLVNDPEAADLTQIASIEEIDGLNQLPNLPGDLGPQVVYAGSTTGPGYNEKASPFQVTWGVNSKVVKMDINSVGAWLADNPFDENHAHGVRNLVTNPDLLSPIN